MGTFGYEEIGTLGVALNHYIKGSHFTCPEKCIAESITVALYGMGVGNATVKCGIYKRSDNSFVGETEEKLVSLGITWAWMTFNFISPKPVLEASVDYYLVAWAKAGTTVANVRYASEAAKGGEQALIYDGWPDPWTPTSIDSKFSIYCLCLMLIPPPVLRELPWWQ